MDIKDILPIIKGFLDKKGLNSGMSSGGISAGKASLAAYKAAIIILALVLAVAIGYISFVYMPIKEANRKKTEELNKTIEMKNQLATLDSQIETLKKKLDKSKEQYVESLAHFGNSEDLGSLYQTVSTLAAKYNLVVLNVKEIAPPPPVVAKAPTKPAADAAKKANGDVAKKDDKDKAAALATAEPKKPAVEVKEIKVEIELKGRYGEYIKFKEDLSVAEILLKVNSETIMVKDDKTDQGSIYVKLNLSTYAIDKKPFQGIITDQANEKTN